MDKFQKYSRLMLLLAGGFFGFILLIGLLIFILRLFSITMFHIPGFDLFFQYVILIIPYLIFFAAYYYLYRKIGASKTKFSRVFARILMVAGFTICVFTLVLSTAIFLHVKSEWLKQLEEYTHYALVMQLAILSITAGVLASGDAKEKDWMERNT
ncbi:MAG: hypothetical protein JWP81_5039 [Ferruginibacter sp.]|nr:hypothetical protein [Ferruginibacter sp.]